MSDGRCDLQKRFVDVSQDFWLTKDIVMISRWEMLQKDDEGVRGRYLLIQALFSEVQKARVVVRF